VLERSPHQAREDAAKQGNPDMRKLFENTERSYTQVAAKCERLAREPEAAPVALEFPVFRTSPSSGD
jgi:hypothetical protein